MSYCYKIKIAVAIFAMAICFLSHAEPGKSRVIWEKLSNDAIFFKTPKEKLVSTQQLLDSFNNWRLPKDSVYVRLLDRLGLYYYLTSGDLENAIRYAAQSIQASKKLNKGHSNIVNAAAYRNIAYYFKLSEQYKTALNYFDTAILITKTFSGKEDAILDCREMRCYLLFQMGDYGKITEESTRALFECRQYSLQCSMHIFYNTRSQAFNYQNELSAASVDADSALKMANNCKDTFEMASAIKTKAIIEFKNRNFSLADSLFMLAFRLRMQTNNNWQVSDDYTDYGYFIADSLHHYRDAIKAHTTSNKFASIMKDSSRMAISFTNIGVAYFRLNNYPEAFKYYRLAFSCLGIQTSSNDLANLSASSLNKVYKKDLLTSLLGNYMEVLLQLYKNNMDEKFINASLRVGLVTDSVITFLRHEQLGEQSKLYWRNKTREFYSNAIEGCFQKQDLKHAFYFMEKSRAVLLNDRLNELGAGNKLPLDVSQYEQQLQLNILRQQQNLNTYNKSSAEYQVQMNKLLILKDSLDRFVRSIEAKYPVYYQYKYSDKVPALADLQLSLKKNGQHFLEYFVTDTCIYSLSISGADARLLRISTSDISRLEIRRLIALNSNLSLLNKNYKEYVLLSEKAFRALFGKAGINTNRIILCPDEIFFPVEALCTDHSGKSFLLQQYSVSYTYSASWLLGKNVVSKSANNFAGYAPGIFSYNSSLPPLPGSVEALKNAGAFFSNASIFKGEEASKLNFISNLPKYSIVNLYSHAIADSGGSGPAIYMYDSLIRLSELGMIRNEATQLVILSACETSAGKNFTGEGIYSMARGFASIGVPSVAATLWKADENAIYEITAVFNQQLSKGINKDEALRIAKLQYIKNHNGAGLLPFYWANLILIGDAGPVLLSGGSSMQFPVRIILIIIVILTIIAIIRKYNLHKL